MPVVLDEFRRVAADGCPLIGLATGGTFGPAWRALAEELQSGRLAGGFKLTHLDEYLEFEPERPGGMVHELITLCPPIRQMWRDGTFLPVPHVDVAEAIVEHERRLTRAGGVALQFLGIGRNGHIAFNEPGANFDRGFHVTALAEATRSDTRGRFAPAEPPRKAITSGIATILGARRLVLCAFGRHKADAVTAMLRAEVGPSCPATAIRRHGNALVLLDREAASGLGDGVDIAAGTA